ncbi:MAG: hypothetical protein WCO10_02630 [bacterium]
MNIVLIGGHPKGYEIPFHPKTRSGKIIRKLANEIGIEPEYFDLWDNQKEEDSRVLSSKTLKRLKKIQRDKTRIIALGRYIEKVLIDNGYGCHYLPHPASRDKKYLEILKKGLIKIK